jgi:hypothetical protein
MTYNTPLRLTILHLAQRFLIEEDTFMIPFSLFGMTLSDQILRFKKDAHLHSRSAGIFD